MFSLNVYMNKTLRRLPGVWETFDKTIQTITNDFKLGHFQKKDNNVPVQSIPSEMELVAFKGAERRWQGHLTVLVCLINSDHFFCQASAVSWCLAAMIRKSNVCMLKKNKNSLNQKEEQNKLDYQPGKINPIYYSLGWHFLHYQENKNSLHTAPYFTL